MATYRGNSDRDIFLVKLDGFRAGTWNVHFYQFKGSVGDGSDWYKHERDGFLYGQDLGDQLRLYGEGGNDLIDIRTDESAFSGVFKPSGQKDYKGFLYGGSGHDEVHGGSRNDYIEGNSGHDELYGHRGADEIKGGTGNDDIYGGDGDDTLEGGDGNDYISGGKGEDEIDGGEGNDTIIDKGDDGKIYGRDGDDTIIIDGGIDVHAGNGDDIIFANLLADGTANLKGGNGSDMYILAQIDDVQEVAQRGVDWDFFTKTMATSSLDLIMSKGFDILFEAAENWSPVGSMIKSASTNLLGQFIDILRASNDGAVANDVKSLYTIQNFDPREDSLIFNFNKSDEVYLAEAVSQGNSVLWEMKDEGGELLARIKLKDSFLAEYDYEIEDIQTVLNNYLDSALVVKSDSIKSNGESLEGDLDDYGISLSDIGVKAQDKMWVIGSYAGQTFDGGENGSEFITGSDFSDVIMNVKFNPTEESVYDLRFGMQSILRGAGGDDLIFGAGANDKLYGGKGNDILMGGLGDDIYIGGDGDDTFHVGYGHDTIADYSFGDTIVIDDSGDFDDILNLVHAAVEKDGDVVIEFDSDNSLTLSDATLSDLQLAALNGDFIYA